MCIVISFFFLNEQRLNYFYKIIKQLSLQQSLLFIIIFNDRNVIIVFVISITKLSIVTILVERKLKQTETKRFVVIMKSYIRLFLFLIQLFISSSQDSIFYNAYGFVTETASTSFDWMASATGITDLCPYVDNIMESLNARYIMFICVYNYCIIQDAPSNIPFYIMLYRLLFFPSLMCLAHTQIHFTLDIIYIQ